MTAAAYPHRAPSKGEPAARSILRQLERVSTGGREYTGGAVFYLFLLGVAAVGGAIYLLLIAFGLFPGLKEERIGVLEPLPTNLGQWSLDTESDQGRDAAAAGHKREVRFLFQEGGLLGGGKLLRQTRVRDAATNEILQIFPDEVIKRQRIRTRAE